MTRRALAALSAVVLSACLLSKAPNAAGSVDVGGGTSDAVRLVYLGTGGWIVEHADELVLTAPLFSNPGLTATGLTGFHSDTALVGEHMVRYAERYDLARTSAILVGHGHYDHLMDVPYVARRFTPGAQILASATAANLLGSWSGVGERVRVVNESAGDQHRAGRWLSVGRRTRVMALRSSHAPHFDGYTLYPGTRETPADREPASATEWVAGETFAYLIDFMSPTEPEAVAFRVYYSDAVSAPPFGFAPEGVVSDRPIDVAILVPSTFDQVDWHPEAFVDNLKPRWVLLGHWEDFFIPVDAPTRSLRLADLGHFESRLSRVFDGDWWRPDIGTEFRFPVR